MEKLFLTEYFEDVRRLLVCDELFFNLASAKDAILDMNSKGGRLLMAGNGASANIVGHACVDFTKQANIQALSFHDPGFITAFSNDFGFENWVAKALEHYLAPHDIFLCVSVSGTSKNIVNACNFAKKRGHKVISFSGKTNDNATMQSSDIKFFVDSKAYNIVEGIHMLWLTSIVDLIRGESVYEVA